MLERLQTERLKTERLKRGRLKEEGVYIGSLLYTSHKPSWSLISDDSALGSWIEDRSPSLTNAAVSFFSIRLLAASLIILFMHIVLHPEPFGMQEGISWTHLLGLLNDGMKVSQRFCNFTIASESCAAVVKPLAKRHTSAIIRVSGRTKDTARNLSTRSLGNSDKVDGTHGEKSKECLTNSLVVTVELIVPKQAADEIKVTSSLSTITDGLFAFRPSMTA